MPRTIPEQDLHHYTRLRDNGVNQSEAARLAGISRATACRLEAEKRPSRLQADGLQWLVTHRQYDLYDQQAALVALGEAYAVIANLVRKGTP